MADALLRGAGGNYTVATARAGLQAKLARAEAERPDKRGNAAGAARLINPPGWPFLAPPGAI